MAQEALHELHFIHGPKDFDLIYLSQFPWFLFLNKLCLSNPIETFDKKKFLNSFSCLAFVSERVVHFSNNKVNKCGKSIEKHCHYATWFYHYIIAVHYDLGTNEPTTTDRLIIHTRFCLLIGVVR